MQFHQENFRPNQVQSIAEFEQPNASLKFNPIVQNPLKRDQNFIQLPKIDFKNYSSEVQNQQIVNPNNAQ